jgi:hypothetical protein
MPAGMAGAAQVKVFGKPQAEYVGLVEAPIDEACSMLLSSAMAAAGYMKSQLSICIISTVMTVAVTRCAPRCYGLNLHSGLYRGSQALLTARAGRSTHVGSSSSIDALCSASQEHKIVSVLRITTRLLVSCEFGYNLTL